MVFHGRFYEVIKVLCGGRDDAVLRPAEEGKLIEIHMRTSLKYNYKI